MLWSIKEKKRKELTFSMVFGGNLKQREPISDFTFRFRMYFSGTHSRSKMTCFGMPLPGITVSVLTLTLSLEI
jgi:hypothetical protein